MTDNRVSYGDLLVLLPEYGVLICKRCQYAVQPSALSSHLLRHHIYRDERRKILEDTKDLLLLQPDDVPIPQTGINPIAELPVHLGRRCLAAGCGHLCQSEKRMSHHWSEEHDSLRTNDRPALVQTFFKGNKLKYFEVGRNFSSHELLESPSAPFSPDTSLRNQRRSTSQAESSASVSTLSSAGDSITEEAGTLQLMHHYSAYAFRTMCGGLDDEGFWQGRIPEEAFKYSFLLHSLLALAATHKAYLAFKSEDHRQVRSYLQLAAKHQSDGLPQFRLELENPSYSNSTALVACSRIIGTTRSAEARLETLLRSAHDLPRQSPSTTLVEFLLLFQGTTRTQLDMQRFLPGDSSFLVSGSLLAELSEASAIMENAAPHMVATAFHHLESCLEKQAHDSPLTRHGRELVQIQPNLVELLGELSTDETETVLKFLLILIRGFDECCQAIELWQLWKGVEMLAINASPQFIELINKEQPLALIIFAFWSSLFQSLEDRYWFMEGQAQHLIDLIKSVLKPSVVELLPSGI